MRNGDSLRNGAGRDCATDSASGQTAQKRLSSGSRLAALTATVRAAGRRVARPLRGYLPCPAGHRHPPRPAGAPLSWSRRRRSAPCPRPPGTGCSQRAGRGFGRRPRRLESVLGRCRRTRSGPVSRPSPRKAAARVVALWCTRRAIAVSPSRAVVGRVHGGHHGEQHLRGADVARRLLPADVLLPRLQREPVGGVAVRVDRKADQAAWQLALEVVPHRDIGGVRAAKPGWYPEPLRGADRDVRAKLAGRAQQASARAGRLRRRRARRTRVPPRLRAAGRVRRRSRLGTAAARRTDRRRGCTMTSGVGLGDD